MPDYPSYHRPGFFYLLFFYFLLLIFCFSFFVFRFSIFGFLRGFLFSVPLFYMISLTPSTSLPARFSLRRQLSHEILPVLRRFTIIPPFPSARCCFNASGYLHLFLELRADRSTVAYPRVHYLPNLS